MICLPPLLHVVGFGDGAWMTMEQSRKRKTRSTSRSGASKSSSLGIQQNQTRVHGKPLHSRGTVSSAKAHSSPETLVDSPSVPANVPLFQVVEDGDHRDSPSSKLTPSASAVSPQSTNAVSQRGCNHDNDSHCQRSHVVAGRSPDTLLTSLSSRDSSPGATLKTVSPSSSRLIQNREKHYSYLLQIQQLVNTSLSKDVSSVVKRAMQASEECDPDALSQELAQSNDALKNVLAAAMVTKTVAYYRGGQIVDRNVPASFLLSMSSYSVRQLHSIFLEEDKKLNDLLGQYKRFNNNARDVMVKRKQHLLELEEQVHALKHQYESRLAEQHQREQAQQPLTQHAPSKTSSPSNDEINAIAIRAQKEISNIRSRTEDRIAKLQESLQSRIQETEQNAENDIRMELEQRYREAVNRLDTTAESLQGMEKRLHDVKKKIQDIEELRWYKRTVRRLLDEMGVNSYERSIWYSCVIAAAKYDPALRKLLECCKAFMESYARHEEPSHPSQYAQRAFLDLRNLRTALLNRNLATKFS